MNRRFLAGTAMAGLLAAVGGGTAGAQDIGFEESFVFGDSLSDTGSSFAATGGRSNPFGANVQPNGALYNTAFPASLQDPTQGEPTQRFSNGDTHIDVLAGDLTPVVGPFDDAPNAQPIPQTPLQAPVDVNPSQSFDPNATGPDGFNFAHGGAETGQTSGDGANTGFLSQVEAFATLQGSGQVTVDPNDGAVVFVGGNDFFNAARNGTLSAQTVQTALQNVGVGLNTLAGSGVDNMVVYTMPDLSQVPLGQELAGLAPTQQQGQQLVAGLQQLSTAFNAQLRSQVLDPLRDQGVDVTVVDMQTLFNDIARQPEAYGVRTGDTHCFSLTANGGQGAPTGDCQTSEEVAQTTFLDSLHPTTTGHDIIASFAQGTMFTRDTAGPVFGTLPQMAHIAADGHFSVIDSRLRSVRAGARGVSFLGQQMATESGAGRDRSGDRAHDTRLSVFVYVNHNGGDRPARSGTAGYDYDQQLITAGADYEINDAVLLGVSAGYSTADASLDGGLGDMEVDSKIFSVYSTAKFNGFYGDLTATISLDQHDTERRTGGPLGKADGEGDGKTLGVAFNGGYTIKRGNLSFGPTAGVRLIDTEIEDFNETGAGALNLAVEDLDAEAVIASFGGQISGRYSFGDGNTIIPELSLSYERDLKDDSFTVATVLPGNQRFSSEASVDRDDAAILDGGVTIGMRNGLSASLGGRLSIGRDGSDHSVRGRLRYTF